MEDALKLIEARLMTLEEVTNYCTEAEKDPMITSKAMPLYVEYSNDKPWNTRWATVEILDSWTNGMFYEYGKEWRCWTSRPTDEQRKAVKWDDSN